MKLYALTGCPYCEMVEERLEQYGVEYERIEVPRDHSDRHEVIEVSGQPTVPVLVDGDVMLDDEEKILPYLDAKFGQKVNEVEVASCDDGG